MKKRMVLPFFLLTVGILLSIAGLAGYLALHRSVSDAEQRLHKAPPSKTYHLGPDVGRPRGQRGPMTVTEISFESEKARWEYTNAKEQAETYSFVSYMVMIAGGCALVPGVFGLILARGSGREKGSRLLVVLVLLIGVVVVMFLVLPRLAG